MLMLIHICKKSIDVKKRFFTFYLIFTTFLLIKNVDEQLQLCLYTAKRNWF